MPEARAQVILAFDFGLRRIGIASGDTVSATAAPCTAVAVTDRGVDWAAIQRLLKQFRPDVLVVGNPLNADGTAGRMSAPASQFAAELATQSRLPVQRTNEFASSFEASARLKGQRESGQRRRRVQRGDIDSAAAAIILERWLNGEGRGDD
jgi:putative holliday junction resolvase